jgi:hypothetical protein
MNLLRTFLSVVATATCISTTFAITTQDVFKKYPNEYFVETGTFVGEGVQMALACGFQQIYSIELAEKYYLMSKQRFQAFDNVHIIEGDSGKILGDVIAVIDKPITFWLDGHWSNGDTAKGDTYTPLMQELDMIKKHPIKTHTILIDDIRCLEHPEFDWLTKEDLIKKILEINPKYQIRYENGYIANDVLVAFVP